MARRPHGAGDAYRPNSYYSRQDPHYAAVPHGSRGRQGGGCLGCLGVIALLVAIVVVLIVWVVPPAVRNAATTYATNTLERLGVDISEREVDANALGYMGSTLTEAQQATYLQLHAGIVAMEEDFPVEAQSVDDVDVAYKALMSDHPELFWLDGSCTYSYVPVMNSVTVTPGYSVSLDEVPGLKSTIEAEADAFLSGLSADASQYDIALDAYTYVIDTTDYVLGADQSQNIQSVFINHSSVCAGYARAYQYLLQRAGLFCAYVEGKINSSGEDHAWNLVRIDDKYAYVDTTWGDPTYSGGNGQVSVASVIYDYFCLTTEEITRDDHTLANESLWPVCDATDLDWYRRAGLMFDSADDAGMSDAFWRQANEGNMAAFKFSNADAYAAAVSALQDGTFMSDELLGIAANKGVDSLSYNYTQSDSLRIVKLFW